MGLLFIHTSIATKKWFPKQTIGWEKLPDALMENKTATVNGSAAVDYFTIHEKETSKRHSDENKTHSRGRKKFRGLKRAESRWLGETKLIFWWLIMEKIKCQFSWQIYFRMSAHTFFMTDRWTLRYIFDLIRLLII